MIIAVIQDRRTSSHNSQMIINDVKKPDILYVLAGFLNALFRVAKKHFIR